MATCTAPAPAPAPAAMSIDPGKDKGLWLPVPAHEKDEEEKEKPLTRLAPTKSPADPVQPGKKTRRPPVPMTDEERKKLLLLKDLHRSGTKELHELLETRKELQKKRDDLLFRQRCLAARLVDRIIFQRREAAYVKHERRIGLKPGDDLPEELRKARRPISLALFLYSDMGRAMEIGLDRFLVEYAHPMDYKKEVEPEAVCDQTGAPLDSVAAK